MVMYIIDQVVSDPDAVDTEVMDTMGTMVIMGIMAVMVTTATMVIIINS
jgi:hypothetical protein